MQLFSEAGWQFRDNRLVNASGEAMRVTFVAQTATQEKILNR